MTAQDGQSGSRRTVVYIDRAMPQGALCTVAGVALPPESMFVPRADFPPGMWQEAAAGKVFFAYANLAAERPEDVNIERIEREWGVTDGPLHFEADDA